MGGVSAQRENREGKERASCVWCPGEGGGGRIPRTSRGETRRTKVGRIMKFRRFGGEMGGARRPRKNASRRASWLAGAVGTAALGVAGCARANRMQLLPVKEGSYGMAALKRRFNDLDLDRKGTINEADMKEALIKLQLPTSEESIQNFFNEVTGHAGPPFEITFSQFANFAVAREKELLQTFNMMDTHGYGFISEEDLAKVLEYMNYR